MTAQKADSGAWRELLGAFLVALLFVLIVMLATSCALYEAVVGTVEQSDATLEAIQFGVEQAAEELDGIGAAIQQAQGTLEAVEDLGQTVEYLLIMFGAVMVHGLRGHAHKLGKRLLNGKKRAGPSSAA